MRGGPALVVLCGCRGILGIHDVEDGRDAPPQPDTASPDAPGDGVAQPDQVANACPSDFVQLPGGSAHVYRLENGPDVYGSQAADCEALAATAYLVIPDDQAELDALVGLSPTSFWIGIDDLQQEGTYRTVKGTVATFLPFALNEPSGNTQQNCLFADDNGGFHDQQCSSNLQAFCECEP